MAAVLEDGVGVATGLLWLLVGLRVAGRGCGEGRGGRAPLTRTGKTKGAHGNHSRKGAVDILSRVCDCAPVMVVYRACNCIGRVCD